MCASACAGLPAESRADAMQSLALETIRRHGASPDRARVNVQWLRTRAHSHFIDQLRQRERATGQKASASETVAAEDPVYALASERVNASEVVELSPERIAECLPSLTPKQRASVRVWLGDRAEPLTNLERQHFHAALGKLRAQSQHSIRAALRADIDWSCEVVNGAIRAENIRADIASRGC